MSRPAFTIEQKKLKNQLLQSFNLNGPAGVAAEVEQMKAHFQGALTEAQALVETSAGDAKRAATIAAKRARKALQILVVVEKTVRTQTKPAEQREAEKAARAAKRAAKAAAATEPVAPVELAPAVEQISA